MPASDRVLVVLLGLFSFTVYCLTLSQTLPAGDSGELISAAYTLSIAHPPGYPLLTLLGKLFTYIPLGSIAWRVNLFSAFCESAAAVLLCMFVARWSKNIWAGILAGGLFSFSPLIWRYALVAEVFALNNLFITLLLYFTLLFRDTKASKYVYLGTFVFGLGLTNQHTLVFYGLPLGLWCFWQGRAEFLNFKSVVTILGLFFLGLSPYLYLPIAASHSPVIAYGEAPSTLIGFWLYVTRQYYGTFELGVEGTQADALKAIFTYFSALPREMLYVGIVLPALGVYSFIKKEGLKDILGATLAAYLFYFIVFSSLSSIPIEQPFYYRINSAFWQQLNILVFAWAGLGLIPILYPNQNRVRKGSEKPVTPRFSKTVIGSMVSTILVFQLISHYQDENQRNNRVLDLFGRSILNSLPPNSIVLSKGDVYTNTFRYLLHAEHLRSDIYVIDRTLLYSPWINELVKNRYQQIVIPGDFRKTLESEAYFRPRTGTSYSLKKLFDANIQNHPVFAVPFTKKMESVWSQYYKSRPYGFLDQILPKHSGMILDRYLQKSEQILSSVDPSSFEKSSRGTHEWLVKRDYWGSHYRRALFLIDYGREYGSDPKALRTAIQALKRLRDNPDPRPPTALFKHLGVAYYQLQDKSREDIQEMLNAFGIYVQHASSSKDPELPKIRKVLKSYAK